MSVPTTLTNAMLSSGSAVLDPAAPDADANVALDRRGPAPQGGGDHWVKGHLSSETPDELSDQIMHWTGSVEDLLLMVMIAVTKDMDSAIKTKADDVLKLRQKSEKENGADRHTEALDQATQELEQMQKQRDQFFQMFEHILDSLTASADRVLQNWHA